ncbi:hypothetical protein OG422_30250 [Streptomyces sp. NBC_01525]
MATLHGAHGALADRTLVPLLACAVRDVEGVVDVRMDPGIIGEEAP